MLKAGVWAATAKATDAGEMHKQKKVKLTEHAKISTDHTEISIPTIVLVLV